MCFNDAAIGDRVYDIKYKWGTIERINGPFIFVKFDTYRKANYTLVQYDFSGKENGYLADYFGQTLFWGEPEFELPKKPFDLKKFFEENFSPYIDSDEDKYRLEYKHYCSWKFIRDKQKTVVGAYYFRIDSCYTADELSQILNDNEIRYDQICAVLKAIRWNCK